MGLANEANILVALAVPRSAVSHACACWHCMIVCFVLIRHERKRAVVNRPLRACLYANSCAFVCVHMSGCCPCKCWVHSLRWCACSEYPEFGCMSCMSWMFATLSRGRLTTRDRYSSLRLSSSLYWGVTPSGDGRLCPIVQFYVIFGIGIARLSSAMSWLSM